MTPEELQDSLHTYLEDIDRAVDTDRLAQRLAYKHSQGTHVVGFRRRGHEVLLHESNTLTTYEIDPSGQILKVGTTSKQCDLEQWLNHHYHYLEWVNPVYRPAQKNQ